MPLEAVAVDRRVRHKVCARMARPGLVAATAATSAVSAVSGGRLDAGHMGDAVLGVELAQPRLLGLGLGLGSVVRVRVGVSGQGQGQGQGQG
jgi:hypothetical protein